MAGNNKASENLKSFLFQKGYHFKRIKENGEGFYMCPANIKPKHINQRGEFF